MSGAQILLKKSFEFKDHLESNPGLTRSELARREGVDPSFLTRTLILQNLAPQIQQFLLSLPSSNRLPLISGKRLIQIARIRDHATQIDEFNQKRQLLP